MKGRLLLLLFFLSTSVIFAQKTITGTVTDASDQSPLPGVSVAVKGTATGTITDLDGKYTLLNVADNATISFSFLGMKTQEHKANKAVINVALEDDSRVIDEVIVTAMGVRAEKRKLNFAVQSVNSDQLLSGKDINFIDALQGKISGVNISHQGGSANAASQMIIRGVSSINPSTNNEPLFIIDGMQISGGASSMSQLNPNDIENVTVLKGAAASALYGQEAALGVVMITTKSGIKGKTEVTASASVQIENVARLPQRQTMYTPGTFGIGKDNVMNGWGPIVQPGEATYDNAKNFLQTGFFHKYDVAASGGTDKFTARASLNYQGQEGVVPDDYNNRVGVNLKSTFEASPKLSLSFLVNVTNTESRGANLSTSDARATGLSSPMSRIYNWPINDDMRNYINPDGSIRWLYLADRIEDSPMNPNWWRNQDGGKAESTRNILQTSFSWKAFKGFDLTGRLGYDQVRSNSHGFTTPRFSKSDFNEADMPGDKTLFGTFEARSGNSTTLTGLMTASYNYQISSDWGVDLMLGAEGKETKGTSMNLGGSDFILPGDWYSMQNIGVMERGSDVNMYRSKRRIYAFFGEAKVNYKNIAQLSVTGRNDNSSTLQKNSRSYFYPSITGGLTFSELFNITNEIFNYGKIRGNWARVGKDTSPYLFDRRYSQKPTFPDGGVSLDPTKSYAIELKPEMTDSWEIGADLYFFNNKTKLELAYYSTVINDQIVTVRVSPTSGTILQTRNEGSLANSGLEASLNQEILKTKDFTWNAIANFSFNRGKVTKLPEGMTEIPVAQVGDVFATAYLDASSTSFVGKDYLRNEDGRIICDENGNPMINPSKSLLIGNREPDFIMGIANNFRYKNIGVNFLVDIRKGGDVLNATARSLWSNGQHKRLETYRDREIVVDGVVKQADGSYIPNTKPVVFDQRFINDYFTTVSSNFIEDGSFIRLTYVTLNYDLSKYIKKTSLRNLSVSLTGRNLLLFTKYNGSNPQVNNGTQGGSGTTGIDNLSVPSTRSFNFSVNATF